ncbi:MAG TPA: ribosomal-processing cysteine protease Prp [Bacillales bacterium]|nr:ribosomal-processing cysteine protease Prp [Bacillales bacterium]
MVEVEIVRRNGRIVSFSLRGHADAGPHGHDLVCAAVSALSIGAENAVGELCGVQLECDAGEGGGYLHCAVPDGLDRRTDEKVQLLLEGMVVSIKSIERQYGAYIRLNHRGGE